MVPREGRLLEATRGHRRAPPGAAEASSTSSPRGISPSPRVARCGRARWHRARGMDRRSRNKPDVTSLAYCRRRARRWAASGTGPARAPRSGENGAAGRGGRPSPRHCSSSWREDKGPRGAPFDPPLRKIREGRTCWPSPPSRTGTTSAESWRDRRCGLGVGACRPCPPTQGRESAPKPSGRSSATAGGWTMRPSPTRVTVHAANAAREARPSCAWASRSPRGDGGLGFSLVLAPSRSAWRAMSTAPPRRKAHPPRASGGRRSCPRRTRRDPSSGAHHPVPRHRPRRRARQRTQRQPRTRAARDTDYRRHLSVVARGPRGIARTAA